MSTAGDAAEDAFLAAALRGPAPWRTDLQPDRVVARAFFHGVCGCLAGRLDGWPPEAAERVRSAARSHAMWEMRHRLILAGLLAALDEAGARALLLKGSALAYELYDPPAARMRGDTDVLVDPASLPAAREVLAARGFVRSALARDAAEVLFLEETWILAAPDGLIHSIDLHHRAFNAPILARLIPFEAAWTRARPLPGLGRAAKGLPFDMALILACAHRAKHKVSPYYVDGQAFADGDRLIWLLDIDLIVRRLGPQDWGLVLAQALGHGVSAVCREGLEMAVRRFGTPVPPEVLRALAAAPARTAATRYLLSQRLAGRLWSDLLATRGLHRRLRYLRLGLLPDAARMRAKYADRPGLPLPLLHLRRIGRFVLAQALGRRE